MFSLDVARQQAEKADARASLAKAARLLQSDTLPRMPQQAAAVDRRVKRIYGRTQKGMHEAYLQRVSQWVDTAAKQQWTADYAKETAYRKEYIPRERFKNKEIGPPVLKTRVYSPRAAYKGGGECVRVLEDTAATSTEPELRDEFQPPIRWIEKSREKHKEIQPPMAIPANKSLECGHYFVEDVICKSPSATHLSRPQSRKTLLSPLNQSASTSNNAPSDHHFDPPPTTAEYVASPQWREHVPGKWVGGAFVSTLASTNPHTAQSRSITGSSYAPTVLISEPFVPPHKRHPLSPKDAALYPREHERRAQTATATIREQKSPQRAQRNYFSSMWTQPGSPGESPSSPAPSTGSGSPSNRGHQLVLRLQHTPTRRAQRPNTRAGNQTTTTNT
ncbi:TPA: hypothetical protein N0F65_011991 [Lagenidium giganteum]|uniref:Uncharacterized protein n=1 Tax=Lagenidium giganteum TaxID=4803 RepID=A0AAV2Z9B6_9STRA|nr:TPA: hypothetical protein N0F65_011991 [Lagenidium giganteum]